MYNKLVNKLMVEFNSYTSITLAAYNYLSLC